MSGPLEGIRVLEVAMYGFVPSAGAVLADWGADVIKVEHALTGDPQRGLRQTGAYKIEGDPNPNIEHANRGKRSIGVHLGTPEGREVIYARGSALGPRGVEAERGGYDMTAFWCRGTSAASLIPPDVDGLINPPPAYGDTISGTNLAGGIAAALLKRERTGETSVVDVSLLAQRPVGDGPRARGVDAPRHALGGAADGHPRCAEQPADRPVQDRRRPLPVARHAPAGKILGRRLPAHRPPRPDR
jgi:crotonobetainyl-CoA:carnitine CoA-transferase CaiB-like acyl-CoA transferase